jgi:hypothetical protein
MLFNTPAEMLAALREDDEIVRRCAGGLIDWKDGGLPLEGNRAHAHPKA